MGAIIERIPYTCRLCGRVVNLSDLENLTVAHAYQATISRRCPSCFKMEGGEIMRKSLLVLSALLLAAPAWAKGPIVRVEMDWGFILSLIGFLG